MAIQIKNSQKSKSLNSRRIKKELHAALCMLGLNNTELSIYFVGTRRMKTLNTVYRGICKDTDVLSFPMADKDHISNFLSRNSIRPSHPLILGDIVISVPKTVRQAKKYKTTFTEEIRRLLVHGLLHLIGYDHEKSNVEKIRMEKKEKEIRDAIEDMD